MSSSVAPSGTCGQGQLRRPPGKRPWRVSAALVACVATILSLGAQPIGGAPPPPSSWPQATPRPPAAVAHRL